MLQITNAEVRIPGPNIDPRAEDVILIDAGRIEWKRIWCTGSAIGIAKASRSIDVNRSHKRFRRPLGFRATPSNVVVENAIAAAKTGSAVAQYVPRKADARCYVIQVAVVPALGNTRIPGNTNPSGALTKRVDFIPGMNDVKFPFRSWTGIRGS